MRISTKAILVAAISLAAIGTNVHAQELPAPAPAFLQDSSDLPPMPNPDEGQSAPAAALPPAAQLPMAPNGGMSAPPTVGSDDPAQRMSLEGGDGYVDTLTVTANSRLEGLLGESSVDAAAGSELEQMMRIRRGNMLLGLKREEADLAVGLWGALFNNEHAQAWRTREDTLAKERREASAAAAAASQEATSAAVVNQVMEPNPVVFEVINGNAIVLLPGGGEVSARVGTVLQNGMKVVAINGNSVIVERDGETFPLGLGSSSMVAPRPQAQSPGMAMPIGVMY